MCLPVELNDCELFIMVTFLLSSKLLGRLADLQLLECVYYSVNVCIPINQFKTIVMRRE